MDPLAKHQIAGIGIIQQRALWAGARYAELEARRPGMTAKRYAETAISLFTECGWLAAWDMGAGKTRAGLYVMAAWETLAQRSVNATWTAAMRRPMLVLGEASGIHVWKNQLALWFPGAPANFILPVETGAQVAEALKLAESGGVSALSISYSLLTRHVDLFAQAKFSLVIHDEIQALTNQNAQRSQALYRIARIREDNLPGMLFKLGLSGTPFTNRVDSLWPVTSYLQGVPKARRTGRPNPKRPRDEVHFFMVSNVWGTRAAFMSKYTTDGVMGKNLLHDPRSYKECNYHSFAECDKLHPRLLNQIMHRVTAEEAWPNLPSVDLEWIDVELPKSQRELYDSLVDDMVLPAIAVENGAGVSVEVNRLALMTLAFECLASGKQLQYSLRNRPELELPFGANESGILDEIERICREMPDSESIIIFAEYEQFAHQIAERLKWLRPVVLAGGTGNAQQAEADFQDPKKGHRAFVATRRGIKALTLTKARYCVIAGFLSYSPWDILQAIYRIRRPGQKAERLMIYALSVKGTLLAWLKTRLAQKLQSGLQVLDGSTVGAEQLNIQDMTKKQFRDAFRGE